MVGGDSAKETPQNAEDLLTNVLRVADTRLARPHFYSQDPHFYSQAWQQKQQWQALLGLTLYAQLITQHSGDEGAFPARCRHPVPGWHSQIQCIQLHSASLHSKHPSEPLMIQPSVGSYQTTTASCPPLPQWEIALFISAAAGARGSGAHTAWPSAHC